MAFVLLLAVMSPLLVATVWLVANASVQRGR